MKANTPTALSALLRLALAPAATRQRQHHEVLEKLKHPGTLVHAMRHLPVADRATEAGTQRPLVAASIRPSSWQIVGPSFQR